MINLDMCTTTKINGNLHMALTDNGDVYYLLETNDFIYWLNTPNQLAAIVAINQYGSWAMKTAHDNPAPTLLAAQILLDRQTAL